jgi:hypothetical protein
MLRLSAFCVLPCSTLVLDALLCDALYKGLIKKGELYPTHIAKVGATGCCGRDWLLLALDGRCCCCRCCCCCCCVICMNLRSVLRSDVGVHGLKCPEMLLWAAWGTAHLFSSSIAGLTFLALLVS